MTVREPLPGESRPERSPGASDPARLTFTAEVGAFADVLLALEATTGVAYDRFVFGDDQALADEVRRLTYERGVADFSPPAARLLFDAADPLPVGMLAIVPASLFDERRRAAALVVGRVIRGLSPERGAGIRARMAAVGEIALRAEPGDLVLARIAVAARATGRGYGQRLLAYAAEEAQAQRYARVVLDVADDNRRAIDLYTRAGFVEVARQTTADLPRHNAWALAASPALTYRRLARVL